MSGNELARTNRQNQEEIPLHMLEELLDMRVSKRILWPDIIAHYYKRTGQSVEEETLQQVMLNEIPFLVLSDSGVLSYELSRSIENIWQSAESDQPGFASVYAKFVEWRLLCDQLRADVSQADGDEIPDEIPQESLQRLGGLKIQLTSLFFELIANGSSDAGAVLDQLTANVGGGSGQDGPLTLEVIEKLMEKNKSDLEAILREHKEEGRGVYRPVRRAYGDRLEDDEL